MMADDSDECVMSERLFELVMCGVGSLSGGGEEGASSSW